MVFCHLHPTHVTQVSDWGLPWPSYYFILDFSPIYIRNKHNFKHSFLLIHIYILWPYSGLNYELGLFYITFYFLVTLNNIVILHFRGRKRSHRWGVPAPTVVSKAKTCSTISVAIKWWRKEICNGKLKDVSFCYSELVPSQKFCANCGMKVDPALFNIQRNICS